MIESQKSISNMRYKYRIFEIIEKAKAGDIASRVFDISIIILIVTNVIAVISSSFDNLNQSTTTFLQYFEYFSVAVFTIEYLQQIFCILNQNCHIYDIFSHSWQLLIY